LEAPQKEATAEAGPAKAGPTPAIAGLLESAMSWP
jgi:hypothetical protein